MRNSQFDDSVGHSHTVLVVEDNKVNQRVIEHVLTKLGCSVHVAEDGRAALDRVRRNRYSMIFMDCQMPEMDGYAATRAIRSIGGTVGSTPIVALTANAMNGDREKCLQAGMDDYLSKPASAADIRSMVEKWAKAPTPV